MLQYYAIVATGRAGYVLYRALVNECDGTCKRLKALKSQRPPPKLIRTYALMERVEIDVLEIYSSKSDQLSSA